MLRDFVGREMLGRSEAGRRLDVSRLRSPGLSALSPLSCNTHSSTDRLKKKSAAAVPAAFFSRSLNGVKRI